MLQITSDLLWHSSYKMGIDFPQDPCQLKCCKEDHRVYIPVMLNCDYGYRYYWSLAKHQDTPAALHVSYFIDGTGMSLKGEVRVHQISAERMEWFHKCSVLCYISHRNMQSCFQSIGFSNSFWALLPKPLQSVYYLQGIWGQHLSFCICGCGCYSAGHKEL